MKIYISLLPIIALVCGCSSPASRNKWQGEIDFKEKRQVYYNEFVEEGGMKNEVGQQSSGLKKEIQDAIKQGRTDYQY